MIIFVCARVLWQTYGGAPRSTWWSLLSALTFASTYLMLLLGQIGGLILLGLTLFLHSVKRRAWDTAGLNVSLVSVKHHLIDLFWLAIAASSIRVRCGKLHLCSAAVVFVPNHPSGEPPFYESGAVTWGQAWIRILLKKSFSENQKKIFRTQMLYIARSELG